MGFHFSFRDDQSYFIFTIMTNLHVDSIRKSYKNKLILSDIYLSCNPGEVIGLIGRNGCGKSTLLKIIFGTESAENRYLKVGDKVLRNFTDSRNLINYLPQANFLPKGCKVKNLIQLFTPEEQRIKLLEHDTIKPLLQKKVRFLSAGEKRILEILLLIHSQAKFILLDEPFNGLSPIMRNLILDILQREKADKGIIITDHDYDNVLKVADKILLLENANLKKINTKKELLAHGYLTTNSTG